MNTDDLLLDVFLDQNVLEAPTQSHCPRLLHAVRNQVFTRPESLDDLLPPGHFARVVWAFVEQMSCEVLLKSICSVESRAGRPAIDPRILLSLWIFATIEGVGSARELSRLCIEHAAFRWLAGGIAVNYHTLSDFRHKTEALDQLLTQLVAALIAEGSVKLKRISVDGVRVRANAGRRSFRRKARLSHLLEMAEQQVSALRNQTAAERAALSKRQAAARERAIREREQRVRQAVETVTALQEKKREDKRHPKTEEEIQKKTCVSTTDDDSRIMEMPDGGWRPAINMQFATDVDTQIITGVDATSQGSDQGLLQPMLEQHEQRYGRRVDELLVDKGYISRQQITWASDRGTIVYTPPAHTHSTRLPHEPEKRDNQHLSAWRQRMGTDEAKTIYKLRAQTSECVNAQLRNRGLINLLVRGLSKVRSVGIIHALAHNIMRASALKLNPRTIATTA